MASAVADLSQQARISEALGALLTYKDNKQAENRGTRRLQVVPDEEERP
jgi:hypothetical protein